MMTKETADLKRKELFAGAIRRRPTIEEARTRFSEDALSRSGVGKETSCRLFDDIVVDYHRPVGEHSARRYHTFDHVLDLLGWCYYDPFGYCPSDQFAASVAILFHDIVYVFGSDHNNEAASAAKAVQSLHEDGFPANIISAVVREILCTDHSRDRPSALMVRDFDLAGLAREWNEVAEDSQKIRLEYSNIPDDVFYQARKAFFVTLQERRIYESLEFEALLPQAKDNIGRIIAICDHELNRCKET